MLARLFGKSPEPSCSNSKVQEQETSSSEEDQSSTGEITNFCNAARFRCSKCFKILNTNSFCSQIECGVSCMAGIHQMLVRIANREDPD